MVSDVQTKIGLQPEVRGASSASDEIRKIYDALRAGSVTVDQANEQMRQFNGSILAQRRAIMMIRTEWRNQNAALFEGMRLMRSTAQLGRTLTSVYSVYTLMQTRMQDKTRDVRDVGEELNRVQDQRLVLQRDLGTTNIYALSLMQQEERLTKRLAEEKRELKRAQDQNIIGYIGIGLQMMNVITTVVQMLTHFRNMQAITGGTWAFTALTNMGSILTTLIVKAGSLWTTLSKIAGFTPPSLPNLPSLPPALPGPGPLGVLAGVALTVGGIIHAGTTPQDQLLEEIMQGEEAGVYGLGGDWGRTQDQIESDLPGDSELLNVVGGGSTLTRDQMEVVRANRRMGGLSEKEQANRPQVIINQTNNIRTDEDREIVDRIADKISIDQERGLYR